MKFILGIIKYVKLTAKYGAVVMAFVKAFEFLSSELETIKGVKDADKD